MGARTATPIDGDARRMTNDRGSSRPATSDRGQTGFDFLVGMSVFLFAVAFVFAFMPTLFDPFVATGTSNALVADRSAAHLAETTLVDPTRPNLLDDGKVAGFFDDCNETTLETELATDTARVNVTLERGGAVYHSCGHDRETVGSPTVSRRIVSAEDGTRYTLFVRVW